MAGKQVLEGHYNWQEKIADIFAKKGIKMSLQGNFRWVYLIISQKFQNFDPLKSTTSIVTVYIV